MKDRDDNFEIVRTIPLGYVLCECGQIVPDLQRRICLNCGRAGCTQCTIMGLTEDEQDSPRRFCDAECEQEFWEEQAVQAEHDYIFEQAVIARRIEAARKRRVA